MGLNLETLIGILVILILLILADGVRRMIRERHGRLRLRIDRRFRDRDPADQGDEQDYPSELLGGPRVRGRTGDPHQVDDDARTPPIMMEGASEETPLPGAEQQSLFAMEEEGEHEQRPAGSHLEPDHDLDPEPDSEPTPPPPRREPRAEPTESAPRYTRESVANQPVLEVIVFHLIARRPERFDGQAMLSLLLESGLRYGDMHIFHRHRDVQGQEQLEFSVANAVEPGTFDIDAMEEQGFAGITFFMKLPGPGEPLVSLDRMLAIGRRMAEELDGELKDEQHSVLTPQTMEHLRQRVQEAERRQRVSHGA